MEEKQKRKRGRPRKAESPKVSKEYLKRVDEEIVDRVNGGKLPKYYLEDKHFSLDPEKRKPCASYPQKEKFEKVEALIDDIVSDVINGVSRSDIASKMADGSYAYGIVPKQHQSQMIKYALHRMRWNREASYEQHRDILWTRYENLYRMAIEDRDLGEARHCLSDMSRIFGLDSEKTMEVQTGKDRKVVIKFGFHQDDEPEDVDAEDVSDIPEAEFVLNDKNDDDEDNDDDEMEVPF